MFRKIFFIIYINSSIFCMLGGNDSVLMLLFRKTTNVFRNHLQQCVQKSFTTTCSEIATTVCSGIAALMCSYYCHTCVHLCKVCILFEFFFVWDVDVDECLLLFFFSAPHVGGGGIHGYCSIWNFYIKSKLCDVSNQWEEIRWDILGITRLLLIRSLCLHHRGL